MSTPYMNHDKPGSSSSTGKHLKGMKPQHNYL